MRLSPPIRPELLPVLPLALLVALSCGSPPGDPADPAPAIRGFSTAGATRQAEIEERLRVDVSADRIEAHLEELASRPHVAGTEGARITAEYVRDRLIEYGWEAEIVVYDAWLTEPRAVAIELLEPTAEVIPTVEEVVPEDPWSAAAADFPGWNGYSASGDVTAPVVYANFGSDADFRALLEAGVDPSGKVALIRYFGTAGTGRKVYNAERYGALGVILYADPEQDGFAVGPVYPEGNWRPPGSIMRRSVEFTPFSGDPRSPGFASVPGAERLPVEETPLPGIPVVPTSYAGASRLLLAMGGPPAPGNFQGALETDYVLGGEATVHLMAEMDNGDRPMRNVVARLEGETWPDQWVVLGNHHDAWIYGAGDPSSGTAAILEEARVLGELAAAGMGPRRTLLIGVWDAEEMLLGGSTEWVEDRRDELLEHAVANINMDSAVFNTDRPLRVAGHASLHDIFREVAATLTDPATGRPFDEHWTDQQNDAFRLPSVDGYGYFLDRSRDLEAPWIFESPSDDAAPFFGYLALPASDMYYGGDYGMYHSIYENLHWMRTVVDPDFGYHALMGRIQALVSLRLANADLLPLEYVTEAEFWRLALDDLAADVAARGQQVPRLDELRGLVDTWESEARGLADDLARRLQSPLPDDDALGELNRSLYLLARHFYRPEGSPNRPWNQNLFDGSAFDLEEASGSTLPGLRFALDEGDRELAAAEAAVYVEALERRVAGLRELRGRLQDP